VNDPTTHPDEYPDLADADNSAPTTRPIVLVVENPNEDPDVYLFGDVDHWEVSSYPTSKYAAAERKSGELDDYPGALRRMADGAELRGAAEIATALRGLASTFDAAVGNDSRR
jgi:hypothetical protein